MESEKRQRVEFVPGLQLAEGFFLQMVAPILEEHFSSLEYTAALIGPGSEILGFDDDMSTDHNWGPRVMLFLRPLDFTRRKEKIRDILSTHLPRTYQGYPTNFSSPLLNDKGTQLLTPSHDGPICHRVELFVPVHFFTGYLGLDPMTTLQTKDWLFLPQQKLRSLCEGRIFRDDLNLRPVQQRLAWYPHDLWLYLLASCWARIGQEEHLMGRAGIVGDELGSMIIASRLVRDCMRLAFLMERVYSPYPKWFGTAFEKLSCASVTQPILSKVLSTSTWKQRDITLARVYEHLAKMHNALSLTPPLSTSPSLFWGRPFTVIHGERFAKALKQVIQDPTIKALSEKRPIGNIDLLTDNTDLLEDPVRCRALLSLYS